jgi:hypothetical protein
MPDYASETIKPRHVLTDLDIQLSICIFGFPQFERQRAPSGGDVVGETVGNPAQVQKALQVQDVGVVRNK